MSDLTIRPKGWPEVKQKAWFQDVACEGEAIFVINGGDVLVEGVEFVHDRVPDGNGARIRFNGVNLTINNS